LGSLESENSNAEGNEDSGYSIGGNIGDFVDEEVLNDSTTVIVHASIYDVSLWFLDKGVFPNSGFEVVGGMFLVVDSGASLLDWFEATTWLVVGWAWGSFFIEIFLWASGAF